MKYLLAFGLLWGASTARAESCAEPDYVLNYLDAKAVHLGKATSAKMAKKHTMEVRVKVEKTLRGDPVKDFVVTSTDKFGGDQTEDFVSGSTYLIFAPKGGATIESSFCDGLTISGETAQEFLELMPKVDASAKLDAKARDKLFKDAQDLIKAIKPKEALRRLDGYVFAGATEGKRLLTRGMALARLGKYEQAIQNNRRIREDKDSAMLASFNIACYLALSGRSEAATEELGALAYHVQVAGTSKAAIEKLTEAVRKDPDLASLRSRKGYSEALAELEKLTK